jgi:hypothetical protein
MSGVVAALMVMMAIPRRFIALGMVSILQVALGHTFVETPTSEAPSKASGNAQRDAAFVNKDKLFRRNGQKGLVVRGALFAVGLSVVFEGVKGLFQSQTEAHDPVPGRRPIDGNVLIGLDPVA